MPDSPEPGTPQTVLFAKFCELLNAVPFEPFRVVTTSGRCYEVPTPDHAGVLPRLRMIHVIGDRGGEVDLHALHIAALEKRHVEWRAA